MKKLILAVVLLSGCTSAGLIDPNAGLRAANDIICVAGLASQGLAISSGMGAGAAIALIQGAASGNSGLLQACAGLVGNLAQDAQGGVARIENAKKAATAPAVVAPDAK